MDKNFSLMLGQSVSSEHLGEQDFQIIIGYCGKVSFQPFSTCIYNHKILVLNMQRNLHMISLDQLREVIHN
jgi:hypothetical protein